MRTGVILGSALIVVGLTVGTESFAAAEDPVDLGSSHVLDQAGVLEGEQDTIEDAIAALYEQDQIDLYVVYVDRFTNPTDAADWANETASNNNLGPRDYLLAVAIADRAYYLSGDSAGPVSNDQLASIESNDIEPALRSGDWSSAAVAAANGLGDAVGGGSSGILWLVIAILVIIGVIVVLVVIRRNRKLARSTPPQALSELDALPLKDLERRAGSALVQTDDAIRTSEEELGFATAQFGAEPVLPFQQALDGAKEQLRKAFQLKQKLDDAEPDTEQQTRDWNGQIVQLCAEANESLDKQVAAFDDLRALEKRIPEASAEVTANASKLQTRITAVKATLTSLSEKYTDATLSTVSDNPAQAEDRLTFASTALSAAKIKATAGDLSAAAIGVRAAEESVDQARTLLDAIDRANTELEKAQQKVDSTIADLRRDLAEANGMLIAGDPEGRIGAVVARTEQTLTEITSLKAGKINPLEILQRLETANQSMDDVLQGVRDARAQTKRAQASLDQTLLSARSRVAFGEDFIGVRRGAIGAAARTRLAEAGRLIAQAEATAATDPVNALALAQRADRLAAEATQLAQQDVNSFEPDGSSIGGLFGGGISGTGMGGGNGALGAILGGILINTVLGGGGMGGGMAGGGRGRGMGGRGRRSGGSFGGSIGSFGGSGTRSRRGGGRF